MSSMRAGCVLCCNAHNFLSRPVVSQDTGYFKFSMLNFEVLSYTSFEWKFDVIFTKI